MRPPEVITDRLGPYLRTLAMFSILLTGFGLLFDAVSVYVDEGYDASRSISMTNSDGIWLALASILLLISLVALIASIGVKRGLYPAKMILGILLLAAISLVVQGGGMFASSMNLPSGWGVSAALAIAAGVVLLFALFFSLGGTLGARLTGSIFAIVFAALLIAREASLSPLFFSGYSLNSLFLEPYLFFYFAAPAFVAVGIIGNTYLVYIAFLFVALGLLFRTVLQGTRLMPIAWIITFVGILLFGIDMAWGNLSALTNTNYNLVNWTTATLPVVSAVTLSVCAFVIITTSIVGMAFYGGGLVELAMPRTTSQPASAVAAGTSCPKCGTQNPSHNLYCGKCGAKLP